MRYLLTLVIGIAIGFGVATWEPARELVSVERVASLVSSIRKTTSKEDANIPVQAEGGDIRSLAEMAVVGPNLTQSKFFDALPSAGEEFGSSSSVNIFTAPTSFRSAVLTLPDNGEASQQTLAQASEGYNAEQVAAQFEALKKLVAADNRVIDQALIQLDPQHPQSFLLSCIRASNENVIALFDFWIHVATDQTVSKDTIETLSQEFAGNQLRISDLAERGRAAAGGYSRFYQVLPAKTDNDRLIKSKILEMLETYVLAFDIEDALAFHDIEFLTLMSEPAESEQAAATRLEVWALAKQRMVQARIDSQQARARISSELLQLTPTS